MAKKKTILMVIAFLLVLTSSSVLLQGCGAESIAPAENPVKEAFYSYSTYSGSDAVRVDGVLDEEVWQGKGWWSNTYLSNVNGVLPKIELTAFPAEEGIYVGSVVYDTNLTSDGERYPQKNSNWELYFGVYEVGESLYDSENVGGWNSRRLYVDMFGEAFTYINNIDRAVTYKGELNSGNTESATLELFIPWEVLGVDTTKGIPESFGIMPTYRAPLENAGSTTWLAPSASSLSNTKDMFIFDSNGYTNPNAENAILGDGAYGYCKTAGWDLSQIDEGIVTSNVYSTDKIFFSQHYGNNFIVEATLIPTNEGEDPWGKAGFTFQRADGLYQTIWLDPNGQGNFVDSINGTYNFPSYRIVTLDNYVSSWNQVALAGYDTTNPNATKQEGVKLTVIKFGADFWYFADGKYLTSQHLTYMDGECMPGFWSLGMQTIYKDFSCKEITSDELVTLLNEKGLYKINAAVEGPGGSVTATKQCVQDGESYAISVISKSGYQLSSVMINGQEMIADIQENSVEGTYTIHDVKDNQNIIVSFEKCSEVTFTGTVSDGENGIASTMILKGITNPSLRYEMEISAKKEFSLQVAAGSYTMTVIATGFKTVEEVVELTADTSKAVVMPISDFVSSVKVNGKNVYSNLSNFDLTKEHLGTVYASFDSQSSGKYLYFDGSGTDFVAEVTLDYTTEFLANGSYQPDLMGGFVFSDGSNSHTLWARDSGVIYINEGWKYDMNLFGKSILMYPNPASGTLTVAKQGETLYVYFNNKLVKKYAWSTIAPNIDPSSEVAIGLTLWTDKTADLEFSNYSVNYDTEYVAAFIKSH